MKLLLKRIEPEKLIRVSEYAKKIGIDRKMLYYFLDQDRLDYTEIDSVKFIVLNERAESFKNSVK